MSPWSLMLCVSKAKSMHFVLTVCTNTHQLISATKWAGFAVLIWIPASQKCANQLWINFAKTFKKICCALLTFVKFLEHIHHIPTQVDAATRNNIGFAVGSQVVFGYSFLLASFVLFLVAEKESKVWRYMHTYMYVYLALSSPLWVLSSSLPSSAFVA